MKKKKKLLKKTPKTGEGSKKDMAEDKKLAKKAGMNMKQCEASPQDRKHDAGYRKNPSSMY